MKPRPQNTPESGDLFRSRLDEIINPRHELVLLANRIDWAQLEKNIGEFFTDNGSPAIPSRLMIGLHVLKSIHKLSDERVCQCWVENPYYQYFCGETYFQHRFPIERSSMTHWRKRLGGGVFESLLQESLRIAVDEKALKLNQLKRIVVDTTVQPKAVAFPTDARLTYKALCALATLARQHNISLRQSYLRVCKRALMMSGRYRHAKQMKRAKRMERFIRIRLGRVMRDMYRKMPENRAPKTLLISALKKADIIYRQQRHSQNKLYSWHVPETECIGKGKADKPYEFGCKVSVMTNVNTAPGGHFVLHIAALHNRPFDGHTLKPILEDYQQKAGLQPQRIYVDKGYRGHHYQPAANRVYKSGQKRGVTGVIKKELRRRPVIEPIIGRLKSDHQLGRNYLKGIEGDKINALLAGAGYNFRLLLRWLRIFCPWLFAQFSIWLNTLTQIHCKEGISSPA